MNTINEAENTYKELLDLERNSRSVKEAHFIAAHRKKRMHAIIGVCIIVANVLIFSPLINLIFSKNSDYVAITIKILAIIGASLAGIQTFFNWQKESELHQSAGELYANIYHKSGTLSAKFQDNIITTDKFIEEFDSLQNKYLEANHTYKMCIPSKDDYKMASINIEKRTNKKK